MASTEEAAKNENLTAQSNNPSETSKPSQPAVSNPVNNAASSKVNEFYTHSVPACCPCKILCNFSLQCKHSSESSGKLAVTN